MIAERIKALLAAVAPHGLTVRQLQEALAEHDEEGNVTLRFSLMSIRKRLRYLEGSKSAVGRHHLGVN